MNLAALQHLIRSGHALAEDVSLLVLGSASLLASIPELGNPEGPLASTYDADLCPDPFDELTAFMLDESTSFKSLRPSSEIVAPTKSSTYFRSNLNRILKRERSRSWN